MSHQTQAETADDATFQSRVRVALMSKCTTIYQDTNATDLDTRVAEGVNQRGERFVRDAAYALVTSGIDETSSDTELDSKLGDLWPLSIARMVGVS